jgi:type VII secretion integral membrane protein EccD
MSDSSPESVMGGHGGQAAGDITSAVSGGWAPGDLAGPGGLAESEAGRAAAPVDDLCRLTVCGPTRSVELAVPVHVPLIDLLPALVGHLGDGLADAGLEHGGWVLQRLGDSPLQEDLSVAVLGLRDGDLVHLRPRADQLPPLDFDDLIDGVAVGISSRPDRWRSETSRRLLTGLLAVPLAAGLAVLAGHLGAVSDLAAAGLSLILLGLAATAARAFADQAVAGVLGAAAICYAAAAAAELPLLRGVAGSHQLADRPAAFAAMLAACVVIAGTAGAVMMLSGSRHPALIGTIVAALLAAAGGALATFAKVGPAAVAGVLLALIVPVGCWVPVLAFRLAGMQLDPTPTNPEELQADLEPVPGQHLLERTRVADQYMTALYWGLAVVASASLAVLGTTSGWPARLVAIDVIALMLLHSRVLVAARHRLAAIVPAAGGAAVLAATAGLRAGPSVWPAVLAGLIAVACLLLVGERSLPGHRFLPHWGRAGDWLQTLTAVALIPEVLWLLNLYQFARTANG